MTNVGEFVKSWTAVKEYMCLQTLLRMFPPGIPVLLFEEKLCWGVLKTLLESADSCLGKRVMESRLSFALLGSKLN